MVIMASLKFMLTLLIKRRPRLLVPMVLMLRDVCRLVYVMPLLLFKGVCLLYFMVFVKKFWRYSWTISPSMEPLLQRCEETNLVLNWEKFHFMVNEGIVLGHKISERGIEVDKAKTEAIERMPYPRDIKGIRSFLDHAGFYRRFIKDFSKTSRPLTNIL